jgi:ABC-type nitrate/sulfonate/bicarbonate transport system permease component
MPNTLTTQPTVQPAIDAPPPRRFLALRQELPQWQVLLYGTLCIIFCIGVWWFVTWGEPEQRILSYTVLPSPGETLAAFSSLWFDRALTRNTVATLWRVMLGFGLAALIGIPLGVLCGCFARVNAFFAPLSIFGRNIPVAALIPLTFSLFGIGEFQKVMFLFIASVAFVFSDTARAISDVSNQYIDTAYTLGANRRQVIIKVLVPLAMPSVFNSLRLLFGLAFGYIMLGELVTIGDAGGLGHIINVSMRRGPREHILLVLLIIPLVALAIDRLLFWVQRELFPHRYKGTGVLHRGMQTLSYAWEDLACALWRRPVQAPTSLSHSTTASTSHHESKQP